MAIRLLHATTHTELDYVANPAREDQGANLFVGVDAEYHFDTRQDCWLFVGGALAFEPPPAVRPALLQITGRLNGDRVATCRAELSPRFAYWYSERHIYLWRRDVMFAMPADGMLEWTFMVIYADGSQEVVDGSAACLVRYLDPDLTPIHEPADPPIGSRLLAARRSILDEAVVDLTNMGLAHGA